MSTYIDKTFLYQIGTPDKNFHVFNNEDVVAELSRGLKKSVVNNPQGDGDIDLRGSKKDFLSGIKCKINYIIKNKVEDNIEQWQNNDRRIIETIFTGGTFPIFFYRETVDGDFDFYYNIAKALVLPLEATRSFDSDGNIIERFEIELWLAHPNLIRLNNNDLYYLDVTVFTANKKTWGTGLVWGTAGLYWGQFNLAYKSTALTSFVGTTIKDKLANKRRIFIENRRELAPLLLTDRHLTRTPTPTAYDIATSGTDTWTLTTNSAVQSTLTNSLVNGNVDQTLYLLKFTSFALNEWLGFWNETTKSMIKITWRNSLTNINPLLFNSYYPTKLFDSVTGDEIAPEMYTITQESPYNDQLYFNYILSNSITTALYQDSLTLQKNTSNTVTVTLSLATLFN